MIKKILGRSVGGTAIAGLVLTAAPVTVAAPQIVQVACPYPATIASSTNLTLSRYVAQFGAVTSATITVSSGAGTPGGQVRLVVNGKSKGLKTLSAGTATYQLPRRLAARKTHTVKAEYVGSCVHQPSASTKSYSVFKAKTSTRGKVVKAKAAKFRARVTASTGILVKSGKVAFVVKKANGTKVRAGIRKVRRGVARVDLKNLPRGNYKLVTRYLGTGNFKASRGVKRFRVR
ncbi:MAG TPA: Ig-like domain-containing protein [Nocardioidaceae bacterium]|nr:Ig-like domain-containing protein [Nocardioidaceae bacterium]